MTGEAARPESPWIEMEDLHSRQHTTREQPPLVALALD